MAPKKSQSSAAAGAGINAARRVAAHNGIVPSPPEGAPSGRPQAKVSRNAKCKGRSFVHEFDARVACKLCRRTGSDVTSFVAEWNMRRFAVVSMQTMKAM